MSIRTSIDLRGMTATYDPETKTFSLSGIAAKDAHSLIWRGGPVTDAIIVALRHALVLTQDNMPEPDYHTAVVEADADERGE